MATNIFQREVGQLLRQSFPIANRLDDAFTNREGGFQVSRKPYDFYGCTSMGTYFGAEAKKVQEIRFPIRNLEEHQRAALSKLEDNTAHAFLFINWRYTHKAGEAIWIPFHQYCAVEYLVLSTGTKSLKPDNFDEDWFLKRVTGGWSIPETHNLYYLI